MAIDEEPKDEPEVTENFAKPAAAAVPTPPACETTPATPAVNAAPGADIRNARAKRCSTFSLRISRPLFKRCFTASGRMLNFSATAATDSPSR
ncbi:hypothetical protein [Roseibacillus ishigakijimensis]|uniref:hypothetical protein n=1 Tax=Roseibacillus ishigakijimensis TaxID=454146 RepID=UPI001F2867B5|nr:hypothetical protein [Roseibacillus ishigakijimensis]